MHSVKESFQKRSSSSVIVNPSSYIAAPQYFFSNKSQVHLSSIFFLTSSLAFLSIANYNAEPFILYFYIYIVMTSSLRKKESMSSLLSYHEAHAETIDESFAESTISKRFSRKKNISNQANRNIRQAKPSQIVCEKTITVNEANTAGKMPTPAIRPEDLFIRINTTPTKIKNYYAPASSDRTETTYMRQRYETEHHIADNCNTANKHKMAELKEQLKLKNSQVMCLEDENMRLKRDLLAKQEEHMKGTIRKEKEYHGELDRLREQIKALQLQLQQKNNEIKAFKKTQVGLNRELKATRYEKILLEKQIEEIYKKKLPKDMKDLMSYRQLSLIKQMDEMRLRLEESKSDHQQKLQSQIRKLKEDNVAKQSIIKRLEVHSRTLIKRIADCDKQMKENISNFNKYYNNMKESQNQLMEQLKKSRKENLKLRRLQALTYPTSSSKKAIDISLQSQQSLNLSLQSGH